VPTMAEAGVPGVDRSAWFAMFGPGKMAAELAQRIRDDVVAVLAESEMQAKIRDLASEAGGEPPDAFAKRISEELVVWRDTAKAAGIEPE